MSQTAEQYAASFLARRTFPNLDVAVAVAKRELEQQIGRSLGYTSEARLSIAMALEWNRRNAPLTSKPVPGVESPWHVVVNGVDTYFANASDAETWRKREAEKAQRRARRIAEHEERRAAEQRAA
jgi:hypothetical protein